MQPRYPQKKISIIGGGVIAFLQAYFAWKAAQKQPDPQPVRITLYEKNPEITDTTATNIAPSLTIDELLAVFDVGKELLKNIKRLFSEKGGVHAPDVPTDPEKNKAFNEHTEKFVESVLDYSNDKEGQLARAESLLQFGHLSMQLWEKMYEEADDDLKAIFKESNFNPCRETSENQLHNGYRIDLIYNFAGAHDKAHNMKATYEHLGYKHCAILSPQEVIDRDPYLTDFCLTHSHKNSEGKLEWNNNENDHAIALWRPGGCIDIQTFLPKFKDYLVKKMGKYVNEAGEEKDCFQFRLNRHVSEVLYQKDDPSIISGFKFFGREKNKEINHGYQKWQKIFCTGGDVGELSRLGFREPITVGFAGASLKLRVRLAKEDQAFYQNFNHCMEVHQEGVVLAWQARTVNDEIWVDVAGCKALYNLETPNIHQQFAENRNILQLNMINDVLPKIVSMALQRNTANTTLTMADLEILASDKKNLKDAPDRNSIATRWVGRRGVYGGDAYPRNNKLSNAHGEVKDTYGATGYGSGGVSNATGAAHMTQACMNPDEQGELEKTVLRFGKF